MTPQVPLFQELSPRFNLKQPPITIDHPRVHISAKLALCHSKAALINHTCTCHAPKTAFPSPSPSFLPSFLPSYPRVRRYKHASVNVSIVKRGRNWRHLDEAVGWLMGPVDPKTCVCVCVRIHEYPRIPTNRCHDPGEIFSFPGRDEQGEGKGRGGVMPTIKRGRDRWKPNRWRWRCVYSKPAGE